MSSEEKGQKDNKKFWDRYAKLYDFETNRFSKAAYKEMYRMMSAILNKKMKVLEIATGTGLIALNIARHVGSIEAIDFAPKMIEAAKKKKTPMNVNFSVANAMDLPYEDGEFDAVIISNALHIIPEPVVVLENIKRVLKPEGILIAPSFSHSHIKEATWNLNAKVLKKIGLETYSKWSPEEYVSFIGDNGFSVINMKVLRAAFPLIYLEARKN